MSSLAKTIGKVLNVTLNKILTALGIGPSALTSTLTSSAASFTAGGPGVTLTFTARDVDSNLIEGYVPVPESGVV